jgi:segregation and condensation protein B
MSESYIRNVIEAALLAAGRPLQMPELVQLFEERERPQPQAIRAALDALGAEYESRGIEIKETASGFRIQVRSTLAAEVSRLWPERPVRYSRALLETLALIAYRQPITRAEIEAVRGVAVNPNILKTIIERNWVRVVGQREVPGRPELLATTREFLDYFGLKSLDELPPLAELKAMPDVPKQEPPELPEAGGQAQGAPTSVVAGTAAEAGASSSPAGTSASPSEAGRAEGPAGSGILALARAVAVERAGAGPIESAALPTPAPAEAADPPSPFVEPVIQQPASEQEASASEEAEQARWHDSGRAAGHTSARERLSREPPDPALDAEAALEDDAEEDRPATDGKTGMAAGPRSLDD